MLDVPPRILWLWWYVLGVLSGIVWVVGLLILAEVLIR